MFPIYVVNNYGQFNHLISRALRDLDIESKLIPNTTPPEEVAAGCRGIILGGGPDISRAGRCAEYVSLGIPVLGICLGLHIIATAFGGEVKPGSMGGYGAVDVSVIESDTVLSGYPSSMQVWASHADEVVTAPAGFVRMATSQICGNEAIRHPDLNIYGLQWHPEVSHTYEGYRVFENFDRICTE
ncbi:MAG TPA: GMP synthase subunit A [Methanospirillum sp.]|nr:GMP synthase subunit A [Methanospirillum sp.]